MLARYAGAGAVAGINTDYFGLSRHPDHGAEGVAVRSGARLDDAGRAGYVGHTSLAISPANEVSLIRVGSRSTPLEVGGRHFTLAGGGPRIVVDGRALDNRACMDDGLHVAVCARLFETAAGLAGDGRTLVLAVSRYLDTAGLAAFLAREYAVTTALKFDGGGSAQMTWLNAAGQVQGFDASPESDGGFRAVAEGLLVFSSLLPPPDVGHGQTVDDAGAGFIYAAGAHDWHTEPSGSGGSFSWTGNKTRTASEWGQWSLSPPWTGRQDWQAAGTYQVLVFIPAAHATTRSARYEVRHGAATDLVSLDQWAHRGSWASLGAFDFTAGGSAYVRLTDATGEAYAATEVAFDAVALSPAN